MRLILASPLALLVDLVPRLRAQDVVHILDLVIPPDLLVHALPA